MLVSERQLAKELNKDRKTIERWRLLGRIKPKQAISTDNGATRYKYDLEEIKQAVHKWPRHGVPNSIG